MATGSLSPSPWLTVLDANGHPVSGALINTYIAGTTTPQTTYTDVGLTVANANPIVADSSGRYVAFLPAGQSFKFVVTDANSVPIRTQDNISAGPSTLNTDVLGTAGQTLSAGLAAYLSDGSGGKTAGLWYLTDNTNAYSSTLPPIGMVPVAVTVGQVGTIRMEGAMTGLTGSLSVGADYYLDGPGGGITSSVPASNAKIIGRADTATSLIVQRKSLNLTAGAGISLVNSAGLVTIAAGQPLHAASGTDTNAAATTVDSVALTGLTANDSLLIITEFITVTQNTAQALLYSVTDSVSLAQVSQSPLASGGNPACMGVAIMKTPQGSTTSISSIFQGMQGTSTRWDYFAYATSVTAAWTSNWTLGLRHGGVTAGGTFKWAWAVYKLLGQ